MNSPGCVVILIAHGSPLTLQACGFCCSSDFGKCSIFDMFWMGCALNWCAMPSTALQAYLDWSLFRVFVQICIFGNKWRARFSALKHFSVGCLLHAWWCSQKCHVDPFITFVLGSTGNFLTLLLCPCKCQFVFILNIAVVGIRK
jgi:hypothetical protein